MNKDVMQNPHVTGKEHGEPRVLTTASAAVQHFPLMGDIMKVSEITSFNR